MKYFLCGTFQWKKFPFLLTSQSRSTLRSNLLVKCHLNALFFSTQSYSEDLAFKLLKFSIHKPTSSPVKLFSIHTSHPATHSIRKRVLPKEKHYVFYEPTQSKRILINTNEILSKDSVTEAIPRRSFIKSSLKFSSPTEKKLFVTKQRGRKKFYRLLPLITRPHRILKRFS